MRTRLVSVLLRELDAVISRTLEFAKFELLHGRAELIAELPRRLAGVTEEHCEPPPRRCDRTGGPCSNSSLAAHR